MSHTTFTGEFHFYDITSDDFDTYDDWLTIILENDRFSLGADRKPNVFVEWLVSGAAREQYSHEPLFIEKEMPIELIGHDHLGRLSFAIKLDNGTYQNIMPYGETWDHLVFRTNVNGQAEWEAMQKAIKEEIEREKDA